jgi:hypothetical protein
VLVAQENQQLCAQVAQLASEVITLQTLVASNCLGAQHAAAAVHGQSYSTTRRGPAARPQRGHAANALAPNAMPAAAATVVREAAGAQPVAGVPSERGVPTPPERTGPLAQSQAQSPSLPPGQISTTPSAAAGSDTPMCVGETPVSGHEVLVNTLPGSRVSEVGVGGGAGGNAVASAGVQPPHAGQRTATLQGYGFVSIPHAAVAAAAAATVCNGGVPVQLMTAQKRKHAATQEAPPSVPNRLPQPGVDLRDALVDSGAGTIGLRYQQSRRVRTTYPSDNCNQTLKVCSHAVCQTDTQTDRHTDRDKQRHRQADRQTHRHTDGQTHRRTDGQTHGHTDTQTPRHPSIFVNLCSAFAQQWWFTERMLHGHWQLQTHSQVLTHCQTPLTRVSFCPLAELRCPKLRCRQHIEQVLRKWCDLSTVSVAGQDPG